jgi:hypothetical protein
LIAISLIHLSHT